MKSSRHAMPPHGNFKDIDASIKPVYYNSEDNVSKDFLVPVLKRTKLYRRETFSFSSAIFSLINEALIEMIKNDCKVQYIVGFDLEESDVSAIEEGLDIPESILQKEIEIQFGTVDKFLATLSNQRNRDVFRHRLKALSYLVATGMLSIKVGFRTVNGKIRNPRMYKFHPKVMIFEDFSGNTIVAPGSPNESYGAGTHNEEQFDVFKSWNAATLDYISGHVSKFEEFWNNECDSVRTIEISELLRKNLFARDPHEYQSKDEILKLEGELNQLSDDIDEAHDRAAQQRVMPPLYPFQEKVITNWFARGNKGIYKLATGAGKTITAIETINRFVKINKRSVTIIVCPYRALCEQWMDVIIEKTDSKPMLAYGAKDSWYQSLQHKLIAFSLQTSDTVFVVTTLDTFSLTPFQTLMQDYWQHCLLVIDECHHVANENSKEILNEQIPYRLGLSATPENETDLTANNVLFDFFKEITPDEYGLSDAIRDGILNPYNYYPIISDLNKDEVKAFELILREILEAKIANDSTQLAQLYTQRDEFVDRAKTKLPLLQKLLTKIEDRKHLIVYCSGNSQLEDVAKIMKIYGIKFGIITANESTKDRKTMLEQFRKGYIQVILSILILDEGIDIPAVKTAIILKSSARTRQSVQRRGRCLRLLRDEQGKVIQKNVSIYDFLVIPQEVSADKRITEINDELVNGEIMRIREFLSLAKNKKEAEQIINERRNIFN